MKCTIFTGITGSERRQYLEDLQDLTKEPYELLIRDPWLKTKELHSVVNEATILNIPDGDRLNYFKDAYLAMADELNFLRKSLKNVVFAVPTHSVFYWKSGFKDAIKDEFLEWLSPDLFVTVIHNMKSIKANLDKDPYSRFPDITFSEILHWREREIQETVRWAKMFKKQHFIIARNEPSETLKGILFTQRRKIYFSYPMSHVTADEMQKAREMIKKLRDLNYIVFDPGSIDDAKYIGELHQQVKAKTGSITEDELSRIARITGDHTVSLDYNLIEQSDMVVVRYPSVEYQKYIAEEDSAIPAIYVPLSAGVICEMVKGNRDGKTVLAVWLPGVEPSPFFRYQCQKLFTKEQELLDYMSKYEPPLSTA